MYFLVPLEGDWWKGVSKLLVIILYANSICVAEGHQMHISFQQQGTICIIIR